VHKTWENDATVVISNGYASLRAENGKYLGRTPCKSDVEPGSTLSIGGMVVEVGEINTSDSTSDVENIAGLVSSASAGTKFVKPTSSRSTFSSTQPLNEAPPRFRPVIPVNPPTIPVNTPPTHNQNVVTKAQVPNAASNSVNPYPRKPEDKPSSKHDRAAPGALVMQRPTKVPTGKQVVDVVVDPFIGKHLRDHQRAGVAFMYECVMGMRCNEVAGAILADEMGLGKTLQTIALLWTLLKQNPIHGAQPVVRKAIVICPATVTSNWKKEFMKWLGNERIGVLLLDDQKRVTSFTRGKSYQILVVNYEKFPLILKDLQKCSDIDIIIADEGHRLKTQKNKTAAAINALNVERRIVLTGTLLQNDYSEWYSVVDFVNPGFLGKYSLFKKNYETPILRSRQQGATPEEIEKGLACDEELKQQTGSFILRRTADVLSKYLPAKTEYVVLCRPTEFQIQIYDTLLGTSTVRAALSGGSEVALKMINILKKTCNGPSLLYRDDEDDESLLSEVYSTVNQKELRRTTTSGKLRVLDSLLHTIRTTTSEKVVIMSNYTKTLDLLSSFLSSLDYTFSRLDGSTAGKKRQELVDTFNRTPAERHFVFLLSTKAGGVGINLIGASRLVMFDIDWNPALDLQAMARICRDGQRRPCFIYRLITKGAIEERIYQRQVTKTGLADSVVDNKSGKSTFSQTELRDIFSIDKGESCRTHDLLECDCKLDGQACTTSSETKDSQDKCEDVVGNVDDDDSDLPELSDLPIKNGRDFVMASQVKDDDDKASKNSSGKGKKKGKLMGLMQYTHLDARKLRQAKLRIEKSDQSNTEEDQDSVICVEDQDVDLDDVDDVDEKMAIQDPILRRVVMEDNSSVDFIFTKASATNVSSDDRKDEQEKAL